MEAHVNAISSNLWYMYAKKRCVLRGALFQKLDEACFIWFR